MGSLLKINGFQADLANEERGNESDFFGEGPRRAKMQVPMPLTGW